MGTPKEQELDDRPLEVGEARQVGPFIFVVTEVKEHNKKGEDIYAAELINPDDGLKFKRKSIKGKELREYKKLKK